MKYPVYEPYYEEEEILSVVQCMRRREISGIFGNSIQQFEEKYASYCGVRFGVAVSNGTVALQLAAKVAGISQGDEVLVSASTNIASALCVYHNGALTVPVDAETDTWNIDIDKLESLITKRTRAIVVVHLFGRPVDMPRVIEIARRHQLIVIEDCAEAHGAEWEGRKVGSFGDLGCFSFLSNKVITTGEGGMVITNNQEFYDRMRNLRNLGFGPVRFYHEEPGYNFRMTAMQAAMGIVQIGRLENIITRKIELQRIYSEVFAPYEWIQFSAPEPRGRHVHWMVAARISDTAPFTRDALRQHLDKCGIETRTFFCPMNQQPFLRAQQGYRDVPCPVADQLWKDGLYFPSSLYLSLDDIRQIADAVKKFSKVRS